MSSARGVSALPPTRASAANGGRERDVSAAGGENREAALLSPLPKPPLPRVFSQPRDSRMHRTGGRAAREKSARARRNCIRRVSMALETRTTLAEWFIRRFFFFSFCETCSWFRTYPSLFIVLPSWSAIHSTFSEWKKRILLVVLSFYQEYLFIDSTHGQLSFCYS